jgi:hypothetical protein
LTKAEQQTYRSLLRAVEDQYAVMAKVRLWDFIWLTNDPPDRKRYLGNLSCRHVDFLICDRYTLAPRLVIELDDRSHQKPEAIAADRYKDELFKAASLPILRLDHPAYTSRVLRTWIDAALDEKTPEIDGQ